MSIQQKFFKLQLLEDILHAWPLQSVQGTLVTVSHVKYFPSNVHLNYPTDNQGTCNDHLGFWPCLSRVGQELTKNPNQDERTQAHYSETKKVLKMLVIVVLVFAILVLPLHVIYIWKDFFHGGKSIFLYFQFCKYFVWRYQNSIDVYKNLL